MNNDRRKLQANSQINEQLLPLIARDVIAFMEQQKGKILFNWLYSSLLLSQEPVGKEHINKYFFTYLKSYLLENIPTKQGYSNDPKQVKIRATMLDIQPAELGCLDIDWFYWHNERLDQLLLQEARNPAKLAIENWNITDLLLYATQKGQLDLIQQWVQRTEQQTGLQLAEERRQREAAPDAVTEKKPRPYYTLLREIDRQVTRTNFEALSQLKLFKFSDQNFYSIQETKVSTELILNYARTYDIRFELQALGFKTSFLNIAEQANLNGFIREVTNDLSLFQRIKEKTKDNHLRKDQKHKLFLALAAFEHVGPERIAGLELYKNAQGEIQPLRLMLKSQERLPAWLDPFKIHFQEYEPFLDSYLLAEKDIFQELILPNWDTIIKGKLNLTEFYQQVRDYYALDEQNPSFKEQTFVFINPGKGFITASEVFYNKNLNEATGYSGLQNALQQHYAIHIPFRPLLGYFKAHPFKLDNQNLLETALDVDQILSLDAVKSLLAFCQLNGEPFFQQYVIASQTDGYRILAKTTECCQVRPPSRELRQFIQENLSEQCIDLPFALDSYREEPGIIQGEALYSLILELVDIDAHLPLLVDLIHYDLPRQHLLLHASKVAIGTLETLQGNSLPVKLIAMACDYLSEEQFPVFRKKITIKANGLSIKLKEIPPVADKITIQGKTLQLSEILKDSYQNSAYLSDLLAQLIALGLSKTKLYGLFGMAEDPDPGTVFTLLKTKSKVLSNEQQLAFVLLYSQLAEVDFDDFEIITLGGNYSLGYPYYVNHLAFLNKDAVLDAVYKRIGQVVDLPFVYGNSYRIIEAPYIDGDRLIAPYIETTLDDRQRSAILTCLYGLFENDPKGFSAVNWKQIGETDTKALLGFEPKYTIYPDESALPKERLPAYAQSWAQNDIQKERFFAAMGIWTPGSTLNMLRASFAGTSEFSKGRIAQEVKFKDERLLFNTLMFIRANGWQLDEENGLPLLKETVRVINTFDSKEREIQVQYGYDTAALENAPEWQADYYEHWKAALNEQFCIYCYDGPLPQIVTVDGTQGYVFHRFNRGDAMIDDENQIYINQHADIKSALSTLIAGDNDFDTESLLQLYQSKEQGSEQTDQVRELQGEIGRLRNRIAQLEHTSGTTSYSATVSHDDTYHQQIKEDSERYIYQQLMAEFPDQQVIWLNQDQTTGDFVESWADHDFEVRNRNGEVLSYIDCKGTPREKQTFYLTSNEWHFSLRCKEKEQNYRIYRVYQADSDPEHLCIDEPHDWIAAGSLVPYLSATETIRGDRVFLTVNK